MSKTKIKHQHNAKRAREEQVQLDLSDIQNEVIDLDGLENILQEDANIYLLNHLLMSVQFFENYDRDNKLLRENWFKEFSLEPHHKKCFYADTLLRLSQANVKFSPRHGEKKNQESQLCPLRVFISSDNVEAAFNPSELGRYKLDVSPHYQFMARTNEKSTKSGCVSLVEYKTLEGSKASSFQRHTTALQEINPNSKEKTVRWATETPTAHPKLMDKRHSLKYSAGSLGVIPIKSFYKFEEPEARLKPKRIHDVKMNSAPATSHEIPNECFQHEEVKNKINLRRVALRELLKTEKLFNSAAFKGYFCDLLIERLSEPLNLNVDALNESFVHQEHIAVTQNGIQYCITPTIVIRDWDNFPIVRLRKNEVQKLWPTAQMQGLLNLLPCYVAPTWHSKPLEENLDYEKMWKIVFPKHEEFLLLHMMHAQVRCYLFVLLIYKSVIESEINSASFGPNHLLHLLFWEVHRDFFGWPEARPAETLLQFLQTLYKKLQNKSLSDFFLPTRNLFSASLPRDLHKAQALIKKIIENPVPYIIRAVNQLTFQHDFYPNFDYLKLHSVLTAVDTPKKPKKTVPKEKKQKKVHFQDDEQIWTKKFIKQMELERKAEKQEPKLSVESINVNEILNFDSNDFGKSNQILQMFTTHFVQMGIKSIQYENLSQGLLYLCETKKILKLMLIRGTSQANLNETKEQIARLQQICFAKIKRDFPKKYLAVSGKSETASENELKKRVEQKTVPSEENLNRMETSLGNPKKIREENLLNKKETIQKETNSDENGIVSVKL